MRNTNLAFRIVSCDRVNNYRPLKKIELKLTGILCTLMLLSVSLESAPDGPNASVPSAPSPGEILDRYAKAMQIEQSHPQPVSMDVDMDAKLPRLKKQGRLHAFRFITKVGHSIRLGT